MKRFVLGLTLGINLLSCEALEEVELSLSEKQLVIYADLKLGEPVAVEVYTTLQSTDEVPEPVQDARVYLIKEDKETELAFNAGLNLYFLENELEPGAYAIRVEHPSFKSVRTKPVSVIEGDFDIELIDIHLVNRPVISSAPLIALNLRINNPGNLPLQIRGFQKIHGEDRIVHPVFQWTAVGFQPDFCGFYDEFGPPIMLKECWSENQELTLYFIREDGSHSIDFTLEARQVSLHYVDFRRSLNQPVSIGLLFMLPHNTYTNVQEGQGLVWSSFSKTFRTTTHE